MTDAAAAPQQTTTNEAPGELSGSVEERANAIFPDVFDDGEDGTEPAESPDGEPAAAAPPTPSTPDQQAAERKARRDAALAELKAKTRAGVDAKADRHRSQELERQLQQERQARAGLVDPRQLTPLQILELGQLAGHTPAAIAEALKQAKENPEYAATNAARKAVDPELAELRQRNSALESKVETFLQQQEHARVAQAEEAAHTQIASFASANAATSPYAASFLKAYGPDQFRKIVEHVLPDVVGGGEQGVLDAVEDLLVERHKQIGAWNPTAAAAPQRSQANPPRLSGTATQAPTHVTNSLAQQRSSVVDEEAALEAMPYEERSAFLFRRR